VFERDCSRRRIDFLKKSALLLVVFAGLPTSVAFGCSGTPTPAQGDRYTPSGYNGAKSTISGSGAEATPGLLFAGVGVQNQTPFNQSTAMYQGGFLNAVAFTSDCGTDTNGIVFERVAGGVYQCDVVDPLPSNSFPFAPSETYAVSDNAGGWTGYLNGSQIDGPYNNLGFSSGYVDARAEAYYEGNCGPAESVQFGQGPWPWSDSTNSGSTWHTITSGTTAADTDNGLYSVGALPSPFTIAFN
jgi:hypothetical protein